MPLQAGPVLLYTVSEVAQRWSVRPETVTRHHAKVGGLKVTAMGRNAVVAADDLRTYEERLRKHLLGKRKLIDAWLKRLEAELPR